MSIRWRLAVLAMQIVILGLGTWIATGEVYSGALWFVAGLLAVIINPQLLEPFYPRGVDVLANSIIGIFMVLIVDKKIVVIGWKILLFSLLGLLFLSFVALVFGAGRRKEGPIVYLGRTARAITQPFTGRVIYSSIFWLSLLEFHSGISSQVWILGSTWALLMLVSRINWQNALQTLRGAPTTANVEGMIGPSRILISSPALPQVGNKLSISVGKKSFDAILIGRIRRENDVWGQVFIPSPDDCETIRSSKYIEISVFENVTSSLLGIVDIGSTESSLRFAPIHSLEIGNVVSVPIPSGKAVLYQISSAEVERLSVKNDSTLIVRVVANQIGCFNQRTGFLERHRWVPEPGASVTEPSTIIGTELDIPEDYLKLGRVIGTEVPVFLNSELACEGHLAILGMTKMGKTSLAVRLAENLSNNQRVVVLDQTGEYKDKRGLPPYQETDLSTNGLCVQEPPDEATPADFAFNFLLKVVSVAKEEYSQGDPLNRVLLLDEAHQFIPEPTGLGFHAPGRDSSYKFGITMMQIRKYGISIILVSQRTAVVGKSSLSQCENIIAFRNVDQTGLDYLEAIAGAGVRKLLPQLKQGEALVFGPAMSTDGAVAVKIDHVFDISN